VQVLHLLLHGLLHKPLDEALLACFCASVLLLKRGVSCFDRKTVAHAQRTSTPTTAQCRVLLCMCIALQVLHLLLHGLLHKPLDEALLAFMRLDEMLIDIGDDLTDYEDDVMANSFNIYRGEISRDCVTSCSRLVFLSKHFLCTVKRDFHVMDDSLTSTGVKWHLYV
jgi:hypothetical protein